MQPRPLAEGNRLQRAYARWAEPYYQRMPEGGRETARRIDAWLYSRRGLGFGVGALCAIAGTAAGLRGVGLHLALAIFLSLLLWAVLGIAALGAWLMPERFTARRMLRGGSLMLLVILVAMFTGFLTGRFVRRGSLDLETLPDALANLARIALPGIAGLGLALIALIWIVASSRRWQLQRELAQLQLEQQRDQAAREGAEARLKLLQGQIQPHFIFNTLAALQHWVDTGDARAAGLLRTLTAFLRRSTDLLGRDRVSLREEFDAATQYLQIMQARMGERLRFEVELAADSAEASLPPGLVLTLVENAVEHGIAPALAGGVVRVSAQCDGAAWVVRVHDDGQGLARGWQPGTGLANCRERLRHHGDGRATIELHDGQPGTIAELRMPVDGDLVRTHNPP